MARTVVEDSPIRSRLQYLTEYLFAGDVEKFEQQLGFYRRQLGYVLRQQAKITPRLLSTLVVDFGVSAHWLLTGHGPVFTIDALPPVSGNAFSSHALFDPASMRVKRNKIAPPTSELILKNRVPELAQAVFEARATLAPVILVCDWHAFLPERRAAVISLLQAGRITALATTTRGLYKDVGAHGDKVIAVARRAARCGVGLGAAIGRWLRLGNDSVFKTAYTQHTPISVYYQPGDDYRYFESARLGPTVGAELGAATQIDLFLFAEQIRLFVTKENSICIDTTDHKSMTALMANTIASAHRTTDERHGRLFKMNINLLPFVSHECQLIFEGRKRANRRTFRGRQH